MASFKARLTVLAFGLLTAALFLRSGSAIAVDGDLADVPFEQLLQTEVITAERIAKQISDAPSAVSVVTAKDIKTYGYRTLAEILDSMRGVSMVRKYQNDWYLSGRGYGNAGNQAGRLTVLIDGYRAQDSLFGQSFFGNDGLIDVDLIERVEYIPGSGSSSYGDSAFLGVVNIITKKGADINGAQVAVGTGSHGWNSQRTTLGKRSDSGLDLLLSVSGMATDGRLLPQYWNGAYEADHNQRLFAKATYGDWTFEAATVNHWLPIPRDPTFHFFNTSDFALIKYSGAINDDLRASVNLYTGGYSSEVKARFGTYSTTTSANWRGIDAKLVSTRFDGHTLVLGAEHRDDYRQNIELTIFGLIDPAMSRYTDRKTLSFYAYDDIALSDNLRLSLGGRHDARRGGDSTFSPRGALIYVPREGTVLKLSSGIAHRQSTAVEERFIHGTVQERVKTSELVWEQSFDSDTRLISSLYSYRIDNYIGGLPSSWLTPRPLRAKGGEIELERRWDNGTHLRASHVRQSSTDQYGDTPANLASSISKLNLAVPFNLAGQTIETGLGLRYIGTRPDIVGVDQPSALIGDLTLSTRWRDLSLMASVRNLDDASYDHVSSSYGPGGIYPEDGRNFWFQLQYDFR